MPYAACQPTIPTARLTLRPFQEGDAEGLLRAGEIMADGVDALAFTSREEALAYIAEANDLYTQHRGAIFAVDREGELIGNIAVRCDFENRGAALACTIFEPWQQQRYATEALRCVIGYSFGYFRIGRVHAEHLASNPAAAGLLEKIGFQQEGYRREHLFRPGKGPQDLVEYGMLLHEWAEVAHMPPL